MAVDHGIGTGFFNQIGETRGFASRSERRVVEGEDEAPVGKTFEFGEGEFEPLDLPPVDLAVVFGEVLVVRGDPAPRTRHRHAVDGDRVVLDRPHPFREGLAEAADRRPPVIVVAPQNDFFARELGDGEEIGHGSLELHGPGDVAGDDHQILRADGRQPSLEEHLGVTRPAFAEDGHGFWVLAREVGVGDGEDAHGG